MICCFYRFVDRCINLDQYVCKASPRGTVVGRFQVYKEGLSEAPYQFTILDSEFFAFVEIQNGGIVHDDAGGTVDVLLKRELDREVCLLFQI